MQYGRRRIMGAHTSMSEFTSAPSQIQEEKCFEERGQFCSVQIYSKFIIRSRCSFPGEIKKREDFSPIWAAINLSLQRPGVHPDNYTSYMSFNFDQILKLKYLSIPFCFIFRGWVFPQTINIIIIFNFVQKRWNTCWKKNLLVNCQPLIWQTSIMMCQAARQFKVVWDFC